MKNTKIGLYAVTGLLIVTAVYLLSTEILSSIHSFHGALIDPAQPAMDFQLTQVDGTKFHLAAEQGKVVLLFFMYTHCPDECPATLGKLQDVYRRLGASVNGVDFVFVTADPQRDTPQVIADWVHQVNAGFIGLSGSEDELRPIWDGYFVGQNIPPHEEGVDYEVVHSLRVYVIDKQGNFRMTFPNETSAEDMAHDVGLLLAEN